MTRLHRDYETDSECDIKRQGGHRYFRHPTTRALSLAWGIDDAAVDVWDIAGGEPKPKLLAEVEADPEVTLWQYNASFEMGIDKHVMGLDIPLTRYRCCYVLGLSLSLGGTVDHPHGGLAKGLEAMLLQVGAPEVYWKDRAGKLLMDRFSKPQPRSRKIWKWVGSERQKALFIAANPHWPADRVGVDAEGYASYLEYNRQDVVAERWLYHRLIKYNSMSETDWSEWWMDAVMNERGVPVDMAVVRSAIEITDTETQKIMDELRGITGLENPNSRNQMLKWLQENGLPLENLRKETIAKFVGELEDEGGEE